MAKLAKSLKYAILHLESSSEPARTHFPAVLRMEEEVIGFLDDVSRDVLEFPTYFTNYQVCTSWSACAWCMGFSCVAHMHNCTVAGPWGLSMWSWLRPGRACSKCCVPAAARPYAALFTVSHLHPAAEDASAQSGPALRLAHHHF